MKQELIQLQVQKRLQLPVPIQLQINKIKEPSLNIISTLFISDMIIKNKDKLFNNIVANISIKRDDELNLTDDNLKFIFFRLYCLGYNKYNITIFSKKCLQDLTIVDIDINPLLNIINENNTTIETKYQVGYIDIKHILEDNFINIMLKDKIPNIFIFENMSWSEIIIYFRKTNNIISGGKVNERHIMNDYRYNLAIFLKCINNINIPSDINNLYSSSSNLLKLYRYNTKDLMKFIKSNINLIDKVFTDEMINDYIDKFYNDYDVSKELKIEINKYRKNKNLINSLYKIITPIILQNDIQFSKKELYLFFKNILQEYELNMSIDKNQYILLFDFINLIVYSRNDYNLNVNNILKYIKIVKEFNKTKILKLD